MTDQPSLYDYIRAARDVPVEVIDAGLTRVDWGAIRAGEADPKDAAAHAIRHAVVAHEGALRKQIAAVRELHPRGEFEDSPGDYYCTHCQATAGIWPCPTIQALEGTTTPPDPPTPTYLDN